MQAEILDNGGNEIQDQLLNCQMYQVVMLPFPAILQRESDQDEDLDKN